MRLFSQILFSWLVISSPILSAQSAQKIIALSPHSVEMLFEIGAGDRIIATLEYSDYPEAALKIPRIGNFTGIQIERVVELQPDLIIAWKSGNKATDLVKLESLGFKIFYSQPKTINEISSELLKLGALTGLNDEASTAAEHLTNNIIILREAIKINVKFRYFINYGMILFVPLVLITGTIL